MATARITSKGQVTIPKEVRERLGVEPGDGLDFRFEDGRLEVVPVRRRKLAEFRGLVPVPQPLEFVEERPGEEREGKAADRTVISFDRRMQRVPGTIVIDDPDQLQVD
jgi:AbrB family looped-hinge helix DNA binding protein